MPHPLPRVVFLELNMPEAALHGVRCALLRALHCTENGGQLLLCWPHAPHHRVFLFLLARLRALFGKVRVECKAPATRTVPRAKLAAPGRQGRFCKLFQLF